MVVGPPSTRPLGCPYLLVIYCRHVSHATRTSYQAWSKSSDLPTGVAIRFLTVTPFPSQ